MLSEEERVAERLVTERAKERKRNWIPMGDRYDAAIEFLDDEDNPASGMFQDNFTECTRSGRQFDPVEQVVHISDYLRSDGYTDYDIRKFWSKYRIGSSFVIRLLRVDRPASWSISTIRSCKADFYEKMREKNYGLPKTAKIFETEQYEQEQLLKHEREQEDSDAD